MHILAPRLAVDITERHRPRNRHKVQRQRHQPEPHPLPEMRCRRRHPLHGLVMWPRRRSVVRPCFICIRDLDHPVVRDSSQGSHLDIVLGQHALEQALGLLLLEDFAHDDRDQQRGLAHGQEHGRPGLDSDPQDLDARQFGEGTVHDVCDESVLVLEGQRDQRGDGRHGDTQGPAERADELGAEEGDVAGEVDDAHDWVGWRGENHGSEGWLLGYRVCRVCCVWVAKVDIRVFSFAPLKEEKKRLLSSGFGR